MKTNEPPATKAEKDALADSDYRFLSGAEMEPAAVLAAYPRSQFVARARLDTATGEIWGIVIRLASPDHAGAGDRREVTTDDGRVVRAEIENDGRPTGDPAAILAAAKYWELPPAYVQRLASNG